MIKIKQVPVGKDSFFFEYRYLTFSFINPSSYFSPKSSSLILPIKPTLLPSCDNPTIEFAIEPPDIVSSILTNDIRFLNYISSTSFIVLLVNEFFSRNSSLTLHKTSTIAFPIPKIFIYAFFVINGFFL